MVAVDNRGTLYVGGTSGATSPRRVAAVTGLEKGSRDPMDDRHNRSAAPAPELTLSAVERRPRSGNRVCRRCGEPLPATARRHARYCSSACKQAAYRRRQSGAPAGEIVALPAVDSREQNRGFTGSPSGRPPRRREPVIADHDHSERLCAVCVARRHAALRAAPRARVSAELVAQRIRRDGGDVWGAVTSFGISYSHALAIRSGFRGAGRTAERIRYSSRGYHDGYRHGRSPAELARWRPNVKNVAPDPEQRFSQLEAIGL